MKYLYDVDKEKLWAIDIEGDGLPSTRLWCMSVVNAATFNITRLVGHAAITEWFEDKCPGHTFIAHNGIGYDFPTLVRLLDIPLSSNNTIDTMVLSMLWNPSLSGGHNLESWGVRLKMPKGDFNDFSGYTEEMGEYCDQDTRICLEIYLRVSERMREKEFSELSIELEHKSWQLLKQQQQNGFAFNVKEAHILYSKLREIENDIVRRANEFWPPALAVVATYKNPYKKDGSRTINHERHREQYERIRVRSDVNEYDAIDYVRFNLASPVERREKLLSLGWEPRPDELTPTGLAKPTRKGKLVPSLEEFAQKPGNEQARLIADWISVNYLGNMVNTWINAYNEKTGCIHGTLWVANTLRYKHSNPNTANIPSVKIDKEDLPLKGVEGGFSYEARDLWTTRDPDKRVLVGVDAKGIQLRILAHYLNNKAFTEAILSEDPHTYNQTSWGLSTRALAKTILYATVMGASDNRIALEAKISKKEAKEVISMFNARVPELPALIKRLKHEVKTTGRMTLCDGSKIIVLEDYRVIPYLLQGDESRIMRAAAIEAFKQVRVKKLDVLKVGDVHDEWQNDALKEHADEFGWDICPTAFRKAGELFKYNLPIDCDAKKGYTWAQTH